MSYKIGRRALPALCPIAVWLLMAACKAASYPADDSGSISPRTSSDTISAKAWTDRLTGQQYALPDSIGDKPVSFYLNHPAVEPIAKAFYHGRFRPVDGNDSTVRLLSCLLTDESPIRPFYRWCLDFTIRISDGALSEYPGTPALAYATRFPEEFFLYMDKDSSGQRYNNWIGIIAYSGLTNYEQSLEITRENIIRDMIGNCSRCDVKMKNRIRKFAADVVQSASIQE